MKICRLSLCFWTVLAFADFTGASWHFRRSISVSGPAPVTVGLDRPVYAGSRADLADLRVLKDGNEVPYLLDVLAGTSEDRELSGQVLDKATVAGTGVQLTVDLGQQGKHNRLRFAIDASDFRRKVRIETSADNRNWSVARADGSIFDFEHDGRKVSVLSVDYPVSTRRYVRATIFGLDNPNLVSNCWANFHRETDARRETILESKPTPIEEPKTQSTVIDIDLGVEGYPQDRVRLDISTPEFYRAVEVSASHEPKDYEYVGSAAISRVGGDEQLGVAFPEQHLRYLRLRIFNRDDRPLAIGKVYVEALSRRVRFQATAGAYWLYYGNAEAKQPAYDLPFVVAHSAPKDELRASLGAQETNPEYREPAAPSKPWSEQHPEILYVTLGLAVIGLGFVTMRFLRTVKM